MLQTKMRGIFVLRALCVVDKGIYEAQGTQGQQHAHEGGAGAKAAAKQKEGGGSVTLGSRPQLVLTLS